MSQKSAGRINENNENPGDNAIYHKVQPRKRSKRKFMPFRGCDCPSLDYYSSGKPVGITVDADEPPQKLLPLMAVEPSGINLIGNGEWVEIDVAVDSGAIETVMSEETLAGS